MLVILTGLRGRSERCIYRASRPSQGTVNGGAVSKWPRCRWDVKHNQTNQTKLRGRLILTICLIDYNKDYSMSHKYVMCSHFLWLFKKSTKDEDFFTANHQGSFRQNVCQIRNNTFSPLSDIKIFSIFAIPLHYENGKNDSYLTKWLKI